MSKSPRIRHPQTRRAETRHAAKPPGRRFVRLRRLNLAILAILAIALFVGLKPISADSLWWDLARGRAVVEGSFTPSRTLLSLDDTAEADWLSGVLPFALYSFLGASAMMAARIAASVGFAFYLRRQAGCGPTYAFSLVLVAAFILCEAAFDPGPMLFDVGLICLVCWCVSRWPIAHDWRRAPVVAGVLFAVGANVAPHVVCGLVVLLFALITSPNTEGQTKRWPIIAVLAGAVGSCCLTPRGVFTLWDSARLTFPWMVADSWMLRETPWQPLHTVDWTIAQYVFVGWSVMFLVWAVWNRSLTQVATLAGTQLLVWPCSGNLPIAGTWLACATAAALAAAVKQRNVDKQRDVPVVDEATSPIDPVTTGGLVASSTTPSSGQPASSSAAKRQPVTQYLPPVAATIVAGLLLFFGFGIEKTGWGIHSRLDDRFCRLVFTDTPTDNGAFYHTAYCDDVRSAGMLSWIAPPQIQVQDVPSRALLAGRLAEHALIRDDLRTQHRASYWRDDGSRGGWWLALAERDTELIICSADDTTMIRSLEPTIWKPLALDSPVLPYAKAGAPRYAEQLVNTLALRDLVDHGSWVYTSPQTTRSQFDRDRWGWRQDVGSPAAALRQAGVFRAMGLQHAVLKVLGASIQRWSDARFRIEFVRCQAELAHAEALVAGVPSEFRQLALQEAMQRTHETVPVDAALLAEARTSSRKLTQAVAAYVNGDAASALELLANENPESAYAEACLLIELGGPQEATAALEQIVRNARGSRLALIAHRLLRKMEGTY